MQFTTRQLFATVTFVAVYIGLMVWILNGLSEDRPAVSASDPPIVRAAALGDLDEVQRQLQLWPESLFERDQNGWTAAHRAISSGEDDVLQCLVGAGALFLPEEGDRPLLVHALQVERPRLAIVEFLLDHGADPNAGDPQTGSRPLDMAVRQLNHTMITLLWERGARFDLSGQGMTPEEHLTEALQVAMNKQFNHADDRPSRAEIEKIRATLELVRDLSQRKPPGRQERDRGAISGG